MRVDWWKWGGSEQLTKQRQRSLGCTATSSRVGEEELKANKPQQCLPRSSAILRVHPKERGQTSGAQCSPITVQTPAALTQRPPDRVRRWAQFPRMSPIFPMIWSSQDFCSWLYWEAECEHKPLLIFSLSLISVLLWQASEFLRKEVLRRQKPTSGALNVYLNHSWKTFKRGPFSLLFYDWFTFFLQKQNLCSSICRPPPTSFLYLQF